MGPARWSPALLELAPLPGPTLVLAPEDFLVGEHGRDFVVWELRGGEVCVETDKGPSGDAAPAGITHVVVYGDSPDPPFAGTDDGSAAGAFTVWRVPDPTPGDSGCPFIADGARADPSDAG